MVLSERQARDIYQRKLKLLLPVAADCCLRKIELKLRGQSVHIANSFGVSPKTVRDIWNRRTWKQATHDLWGQEADQHSVLEVLY
jgi:hypothetical protein